MNSPSANNKRIAKNTLLLYVRTMFIMLITLYTSRVILAALGVEDYGIYNVVGGVVAMFSMISGSLSASISRFITFELGRGDTKRLNVIFSTSVNIQLGLAFIIGMLGATLGGWFLNTHLNIPSGRMYAANWVLACSLVGFCINLVSVPYNACIIAHERMSAFAYVSILEASLKLAVCYLIVVSPFDKLISYVVLLVVVALVIRLVYGIYCSRQFEECLYRFVHDKSLLAQMFGFSGWTFFTNANSLMNTQGVNMLINVYFGVTLNAARGIASQVESAVLQFVNNFTTALNPQITKSYAVGDLERMYSLVCRGAKFSYFSILLLSLPLICEAETVLGLWLTVVPDHAVIFVQLSLVLGMFDCIGSSGYTACAATGKMRKYALVIGLVGLLEFPFTWVFFSLGAPAVSTYYLYILVKAMVVFSRLFLLRDMVGLRPLRFVREVFYPAILTTIVAAILPCLIVYTIAPGFLRLMLSIGVGLLSVSLAALYIGMTRQERVAVTSKAFATVKKKLHIKS